VQLKALHAAWPALQLDGNLRLQQAKLDPSAALNWQLLLKAQQPAAAAWALEANGKLQGQKLEVAQASLDGPSKLSLEGSAEWLDNGNWRTAGAATVLPTPLALPPWRTASLVQGRLNWQLQRQAGLHLGEVQAQLDEGNLLAGLPLTGTARWAPGPDAAPWTLQLQAGATQTLSLSGRQNGALRDLNTLGQLAAWQPDQAQWQLPDLAALKPLWQPWLAQLAGSGEGRWQAPNTLDLRLSKLVWQQQTQTQAQSPRGQLASLQASLQPKGDSSEASLQATEARFGPWQLDQLRATGGTRSPWQLQATGQLNRADQDALRWQAQAQSAAPQQEAPQAPGPSPGPSRSRWLLPQLQVSLGPQQGPSWLQTSQAQLRFDTTTQTLLLQAERLLLAGESFEMPRARWQAGGASGSASGGVAGSASSSWALTLQGKPHLAPWLQRADPHNDWRGDAQVQVLLQAQQDNARAPQFKLQVDGLQGDLQLADRPLGLQALKLQLEQEPSGAGAMALTLQSTLLGDIQAQLNQTELSALAGSVRAQLPRLQALRTWLPGGLQLDGQALLDAQVGGTRANPRLRGMASLQIDRLQHPASGLAAQSGAIKAQFSEDRLELTELRLQGQGDAGGQLTGTGNLRWPNGQPQAQLNLEAQKFRALNRFDRRLVLSGKAQLALQQQSLRLTGQLSADEGVFEIGRPDAPLLDDDVQIIRLDTAPSVVATAPRWRREVDLQFDLGQRLRVQGRGFASRLTGQLQVKESAGKAPQWLGRINTQGGRYKAYGQTLDLESGEIRFTGTLDDPKLDLLAIKPDIEHRVGVSVTGTAQSPRIRLYAEPDLPDNDKLAWLLLGRDPSEVTGRDTALLQRAALALLSGEGENPASQLMDKLGITELSLGQGEDAGTVLRLGAQLSRRWSVGYERSLNATTGSWQLVYRIGQRFRLRAQSGTDSALDLLWLWRFD
jgi:translocation and assembly module TamB